MFPAKACSRVLLKILEGTTANIPPQGGRKHPEQHYLTVNTSNILFIVGGTFIGLEDIIRRRIGGFRHWLPKSRSGESEDQETLAKVPKRWTFVQFGLIPEFVGRLPVTGILSELSESDFVRILKEPKKTRLLVSTRKLFELDRCALDFTDEALLEIARRAKSRSTGVRALRSIIEEIMLDVVFELPEKEPMRYVVDRGVLTGFRAHSNRTPGKPPGKKKKRQKTTNPRDHRKAGVAKQVDENPLKPLDGCSHRSIRGRSQSHFQPAEVLQVETYAVGCTSDAPRRSRR